MWRHVWIALKLMDISTQSILTCSCHRWWNCWHSQTQQMYRLRKRLKLKSISILYGIRLYGSKCVCERERDNKKTVSTLFRGNCSLSALLCFFVLSCIHTGGHFLRAIFHSLFNAIFTYCTVVVHTEHQMTRFDSLIRKILGIVFKALFCFCLVYNISKQV